MGEMFKKDTLYIIGAISIVIKRLGIYLTIPCEFALKIKEEYEEFLRVECQSEIIEDTLSRWLEVEFKKILPFDSFREKQFWVETFATLLLENSTQRYFFYFPATCQKISLNENELIDYFLEKIDQTLTKKCEECIIQCKPIPEIVKELKF